MKVEVVRAWPRRFDAVTVDLPPGACVDDAARAAGMAGDGEVTGYAVFGQRATPQTPLGEGDRVELLRPLVADPKDARRRRAQARTPPARGK